MRHDQRDAIPSNFNGLARGLHWLMACMILAMLFIGVGMTTSLDYRIWLIDLHRPLGIAVLVLAVFRVLNRLTHASPSLPASLPRWQKLAAQGSHIVLYALMLGLPLIGWALLSAGGFPVVLFEGVNLPAIVPTNPVLYAWLREAHGLLAWFLYLVVVGHISAALVHAWIYRDGVFSSMAKGTSRHD
ncbi:cytochrome b [Pseudomonas chlororaphis]|uniref:cytochrome b n=1 Tax=Pseudomonas chlororaphis TaxID=587753 RepID=UPI0004CE8605|nr:cytochrome b [Pseudomonas chlororaphis]AZD30820.1 Cytochrome b561 [Pseudomonas chlororaphis]